MSVFDAIGMPELNDTSMLEDGTSIEDGREEYEDHLRRLALSTHIQQDHRKYAPSTRYRRARRAGVPSLHYRTYTYATAASRRRDTATVTVDQRPVGRSTLLTCSR